MACQIDPLCRRRKEWKISCLSAKMPARAHRGACLVSHRNGARCQPAQARNSWGRPRCGFPFLFLVSFFKSWPSFTLLAVVEYGKGICFLPVLVVCRCTYITLQQLVFITSNSSPALLFIIRHGFVWELRMKYPVVIQSATDVSLLLFCVSY